MIAYITVRVSDGTIDRVLRLAVEGSDLADAVDRFNQWKGGAETFSTMSFIVEGATMNRPRQFHIPLVSGVRNGVIRKELADASPSKD